MSQLSLKLGFWSASLIAAAFILFTICFVAIFASSPPFTWTNLADYLAYVGANDQFLQSLARFTMLLFGPLFVILLNSIHEYAAEDKKILTRIGLHLAVIFAALTGVHYFVQLTAVRLSIAQGQTQGLEHFLQANPISPLAAINMLGWTLFLGLASLFVAPVFAGRRSRLERVIGASFLLNGLFCLLAGIGYLFQIIWLIFLTINLGMGAAVTVIAVASALLFKRLQKLGLAAAAR